jgi:hypothetical protein
MRKAGTHILVSGVIALMAPFMAPLMAHAEEQQLKLLPDTDTFRFNSSDKFYQKRKYSDDFRMKGIAIRRNVYFGEARIAGEKGPGIVVENGDLTWGFNHQGAEIQLRF